MQASDCDIPQILPATLKTPVIYAGANEATPIRFHHDNERVLVSAAYTGIPDPAPLSFERSGPREKIAFDPADVHAGIITCGGLCPGLNDVIRGLVMGLWYGYGVRQISGIRYGYQGLQPDAMAPTELTPDLVDDIHREGGSVLGNARGGPSDSQLVDSLQLLGINQLFVIGGDGTQKGSRAIHREASARGYPLAVIGIPKTIDNDIAWVDQTFGFATAVSVAREVIKSAHTEAHSALRGIGLVKLMGRDSGFVTAAASLASMDANFVLIPEVPFELDGSQGLLARLDERLQRKDHAVIVVAEGAGQDLFDSEEIRFDQGGNKLHQDIGILLRDRIKSHFKTIGRPVDCKYFDPSYLVRSAPANAIDSIYCQRLATEAVHAAMAGKSDMMVAKWNGQFVHIPLALVTKERKKIDPRSSTWRAVLEATGQPHLTA